MPQTLPYIEKNRFEPLCELTLERVRKCYEIYKKKGGGTWAFEDVFLEIDLFDDVNENDYVKIVQLMLDPEGLTINEDILVKNPICPVIISITFATRAIKAYEARKAEFAWSCLVEASFWAGKAGSAIEIGQNVKNGRAELAGRAARVKHKSSKEIKSYAFKLVRDRLPSKRWSSMRNAAEKILGDVNKFCPGGAPTPRPVASKTVQEWLAQMPDASDLFQNFKGRNKDSHPKQESQQDRSD